MLNKIKTRTSILALILFVLSAGSAFAANKVVVIPLGDSPFNYAKFSGPQRDLKQSLLEAEGWSVCHTSLFNVSTSITTILLVNCTGAELMLACRPSDQVGGFFTLAAYAPRGDVLFFTGDDPTTTHSANGSEWYYHGNRSWGFAPKGQAVKKNSCDVSDVDEEDFRMCIHTENAYVVSGYRCGTIANALNGSTTWERVILQR